MVEAGADVTLIAGHTAGLIDPAGVHVEHVGSAAQLRDAVSKHAAEANVLVMAAAVADFRPAEYTESKIKKTHDPADPDAAPTIRLVRNPDILAGLVAARGEASSPVIVGFAAETGDATGSVLELGRAKLERKGCDLLVVNEVGVDKTFGADETTVHVLTRGSADVVDIGPASKSVVSHGIWDVVVGSTVAH